MSDIKVSNDKNVTTLELDVEGVIYQARIEYGSLFYSIYIWRGRYPLCEMVGGGSTRATRKRAARCAVKRLRNIRLTEYKTSQRNEKLYEAVKKEADK